MEVKYGTELMGEVGMNGTQNFFRQKMVVFCLLVVLSRTQLGTRAKPVGGIIVTGLYELMKMEQSCGIKPLAPMEMNGIPRL